MRLGEAAEEGRKSQLTKAAWRLQNPDSGKNGRRSFRRRMLARRTRRHAPLRRGPTHRLPRDRLISRPNITRASAAPKARFPSFGSDTVATPPKTKAASKGG